MMNSNAYKAVLTTLKGGSSAPFTPTDIAGLKLWLKADAITGLNDGDAVTTWSDSSGQGSDATQGTAANKPLYQTNVVGSMPAVQGDGTNDYLTLAGVSLGTSHTLFVAARIVDISDSGFAGGTGDALLPYYNTPGISYRDSAFVGAGMGYGNMDGTNVIITIVRSGVSVDFFLNNAQVGTTQTMGASNAVTLTSILARVGGSSATSNYVLEYLAYDSALNSTQRGQVENYLNDKYSNVFF